MKRNDEMTRAVDAAMVAMAGITPPLRRSECEQLIRAALGAMAPSGKAESLPLELQGVAEQVAEGAGFWRSCSGCHESNEGHPTGPHSKVFGCALGNGCSECGGVGAVWDDTDYDAMARFSFEPITSPGGQQ